jgi:hypothetical protein
MPSRKALSTNSILVEPKIAMEAAQNLSLKDLKALAASLGLSADAVSAHGSRARKATYVAAIAAARAEVGGEAVAAPASLKRPRSPSTAMVDSSDAGAAGESAAAPLPPRKKKRVWRIIRDDSDSDTAPPPKRPQKNKAKPVAADAGPTLPATGFVTSDHRGKVVLSSWKEAHAIWDLGCFGELYPQFRSKINRRRAQPLATKWMRKQQLHLLLEEAMYLVATGSLRISAARPVARSETAYAALRARLRHVPFLAPWHRAVVQTARAAVRAAANAVPPMLAAAAPAAAASGALLAIPPTARVETSEAEAAPSAAAESSAPHSAPAPRRLAAEDCYALRALLPRLLPGMSLADVAAAYTRRPGTPKLAAPALTVAEVWRKFCDMRGGAETFAISYATYWECVLFRYVGGSEALARCALSVGARACDPRSPPPSLVTPAVALICSAPAAAQVPSTPLDPEERYQLRLRMGPVQRNDASPPLRAVRAHRRRANASCARRGDGGRCAHRRRRPSRPRRGDERDVDYAAPLRAHRGERQEEDDGVLPCLRPRCGLHDAPRR